MNVLFTLVGISVDIDEPYKKIYFVFIWVQVISEAGLFFFGKLF